MMRKRFTRSLAAGGVGLSLILSMLAIPAVVLAATPNWTGAKAALPATVTPGEWAGYRATISNGGPSNISQLSLKVTFSQPFDAATSWDGSESPVYVNLVNNGVPLPAACGETPLSGPLSCTVGALNAGTAASITIAYDTDVPTTLPSTAGVKVEWTSVGLGSGDGDNSRGDVLTQTIETVLSADATNFDGGFSPEDDTTYATGQALGTLNLFGTRFTAENAFTPVALLDDVNGPACPAGKTCYGIGNANAIELTINEGTPFGALKPVTTTVYKDAVPKGASPNKVTVVHYFDEPKLDTNGNPTILFESISAACPKNGAPTSACRTVSWDGKTGIWTITVWIGENGFVKYH